MLIFDLLERNLDRTRALLAAMDNPQEAVRILHVAGSKGKATTATHIANILTTAGFRTGLSISPHVHTWRERIAVDGMPVSHDAFAAALENALEAARRIEEGLPAAGTVNASELLLAAALAHFRSAVCDFAILEVGLGGRFDSTNVVNPEVAIITELELEHAAILGPTIREIAWNKGGIMKPGIPTVTLKQQAEASEMLDGIATEIGTELLVEGRDWRWSDAASGLTVQTADTTVSGLTPIAPGPHSLRNAALAAIAVLQLQGAALPPGADSIRSGIESTRLAGHFEVVKTANGSFVLDVAHTPKSMQLLVDAVQRSGIVQPRVIAGFLADKEITAMIEILATRSPDIRLVPVPHARSASIDQLEAATAGFAEQVSIHPHLDAVLFPADSQQAVSEWTVIAGSTALVAETRERLGIAERLTYREPEVAVSGPTRPIS